VDIDQLLGDLELNEELSNDQNGQPPAHQSAVSTPSSDFNLYSEPSIEKTNGYSSTQHINNGMMLNHLSTTETHSC